MASGWTGQHRAMLTKACRQALPTGCTPMRRVAGKYRCPLPQAHREPHTEAHTHAYAHTLTRLLGIKEESRHITPLQLLRPRRPLQQHLGLLLAERTQDEGGRPVTAADRRRRRADGPRKAAVRRP